jgi:class 3 adenylate cyclase
MEPRIQYAKTSDGVNIAYSVTGQGLPSVEMQPLLLTHLEMESQIPGFREAHERVSRLRTLVRYDARGSGLSDRDVTDFSVEALVRDVEAVTDYAGLERFALLALEWSGPVGIAYAARHPKRVAHLVLWHTAARGADLCSDPWESLLNLIRKDWKLGSEALTQAWFGWRLAEFAHQFAAMMREAVSVETFLSFWEQVRGWDVSALLPELKVPTLVAHRRRYPYVSVEAARKMAASIPEARLLLFEGSTAMTGEARAAVMKFLLDSEAPAAPFALPSGTAIILFADIVDSTALTERMGDAAFRDKARELDGALRGVIRECEGTTVEGKLLGDGVLAVFTSARQAIEAALRCAAAGSHGGLPLHLGIHAGDVIREGGNVFGGAVNIAARISALSAPGEVLVSETVRSLARTSAGVSFEDRGEHTLKGVGDPVRVWVVREGEAS